MHYSPENVGVSLIQPNHFYSRGEKHFVGIVIGLQNYNYKGLLVLIKLKKLVNKFYKQGQ